MINKSLFSSQNQEWETPQKLFNELDDEFHFVLDACATPLNAKCLEFFTMEDNALIQDWVQYGSIFMNPPYGNQIWRWIKKAYEESQNGCTVVCLLPARTDTAWWHDYCMRGEIRFIRGRLRFAKAKNNAPFPSAIVIFRK